MKTLFPVAILSILLSSCTDPTGATRLLESQGYSEIQTHGYGWFKCSKGDTFSTYFSAVNLNKKGVTGTVCSGIFKGATVRFDIP